MKVKDHRVYAMHEYPSQESDTFELGEIVTKTDEYGTEIGVIIQIYDNKEYRTDMFGNCHISEIELSTMEEIEKYRPNVHSDGTFDWSK